MAAPEAPDLGPGPRAGIWPLGELNQKLGESLGRSNLASARRQPIRALVLLWHDYLDESHRISQELSGADGSLLHAIMHRREPDYGNAKYWFHRVGKHRIFPGLATEAAALLRSKNETALAEALIRGGEWDPFAFVDACERAAGSAGSGSYTQVLRAIQAMEFERLLEHLCLA